MRFILFNLVVVGSLAYLIVGDRDPATGHGGEGGVALADCAERVADTMWDTGEALLAVANEKLGEGAEGGRDTGDWDTVDPSLQPPESPRPTAAAESAPTIEAAPAPVYEAPYGADVPVPVASDPDGWREQFLAALEPIDVPVTVAIVPDAWQERFLAALEPIEVPEAVFVEVPAAAPAPPEVMPEPELPHVDPANILPIDDAAVMRRRAEVLGYDTTVEVAEADMAPVTDRARRLLELDPATFMSQDERRRELMRLAQDMDDLFVDKMSR